MAINDTLDENQINNIYTLERFAREMYQNYSINVSSLAADENITSHTDFIKLLVNRTSNNLTISTIDNQRDQISIILPITIIYVIIFVAGVLGNVITCTVISRNKCMQTATNYYLFNLAISDLLLLVSGKMFYNFFLNIDH